MAANQKLLSASANAPKICAPSYRNRMSFFKLHKLNERGTPTQMCIYENVILLYKLINSEIPELDWIDLNFQQSLSTIILWDK